jgi:hypothetical protein
MKSFLLPLFLSILILKCTIQINNDYKLLYEWGISNSMFISDKIAMNYTNENNKKYYINKNITASEVIMKIPKKILLSIEKALKLSSSKIKKQYEDFKKLLKEDNYESPEALKYRQDQAFLAYLMYIADKNKSKKNKLYNFYKYFFNTFETDMERYPIFYNSEQVRFLLFSLFGSELIQTKKLFDDEFSIFEKEIYKKSMDSDEYYRYRLFSFNKIVNISGVISIVPFLDLFQQNPVNYNLNINFTEDGGIDILASKNLTVKDNLTLAMVQMPNSNTLLSNGKVFEENKDFVESFKIPRISPVFLKKKNLNIFLANNEMVDLSENKYYEQIIDSYKEISKFVKEDGSKFSALNLFLENIKCIRDEYNKITYKDLNKHFFNLEYVNNVKSVLDTEKNYLDKKIKQLRRIINKLSGIKELEGDL